MELYQEILAGFFGKELEALLTDLAINFPKIIEIESYKALQKIKAIIEDDRLDDKECFHKIEEIVCLFEAIGSSGGNRHDFG